MTITELQPRAVAEPGGRNYLILKVSTDEGHIGYGEAAIEADAQSSVDRLKRDLAAVRGANPSRTLILDEQLRRDGAAPASRAALNMALYDILGKSVRAPLYEVLGGPTRNKARAMAVVSPGAPDQMQAAVLDAKGAGHLAFAIPLDVPASRERGRAFYLNIRSMMDGFRSAAGSNCDFVLDCAGRTTPGEAISIADRMEDFHLLWLDEPTADLSAEAQASISHRTVTPVGFGRSYDQNSRFQDILREDGVDVLRPALGATTIINIRKAAALSETYYIALCPYHRGGPIGTAAGIHISASLANSFIQETPYSMNAADRRMRSAIAGGWDEKPVEGFFPLIERPGLGLDVNEAALNQYVIAS